MATPITRMYWQSHACPSWTEGLSIDTGNPVAPVAVDSQPKAVDHQQGRDLADQLGVTLPIADGVSFTTLNAAIGRRIVYDVQAFHTSS